MSGRRLGYTADKYRIIRERKMTERHQQRSIRQGKEPVSIEQHHPIIQHSTHTIASRITYLQERKDRKERKHGDYFLFCFFFKPNYPFSSLAGGYISSAPRVLIHNCRTSKCTE